MAQFTITRVIPSIVHLHGLQPGQWVQFPDGPRGQYLGTTSAGVECIRWQNGKFTKVNAKQNRPLRQYAKLCGSIA